MPRSRPKVKGTPATQSYRKPTCPNGHDPKNVIREPEGWVCRECVDGEFSRRWGRRSRGGVHLPPGVGEKEDPTFTEMVPNRRARRRMR